MFYSLTGKLIYNDGSSCAVECGGVGFRCSCSLNTLTTIGQVGSTVTLYTHLSVREDALELFGFKDERELESFKKLTAVSGVGPKAAMAILSVLTPDSLALAVENADVKAVTRAQGVGPKLAQRVILELKGKLEAPAGGAAIYENAPGTVASSQKDAVSALEFLGYSRNEAQKAVAGLDASLSTEDTIKAALARIGTKG